MNIKQRLTLLKPAINGLWITFASVSIFTLPIKLIYVWACFLWNLI